MRRTRNKLRRVQDSKSNKYISTNKGLYNDVKKWCVLYRENLKERIKSKDLSKHTYRSYEFLIESLEMFTYKNYNIEIGIDEVDENYFNDFLKWLEHDRFTIMYGADEYISDTIYDFLDYYESGRRIVRDIEEVFQEYIIENSDRLDSESVVNILDYFINEYFFGKNIGVESITDTEIEECVRLMKKMSNYKRVSNSTMIQRKASLTALFSFISISNIEKKDLTAHFKYIKVYKDKGSDTKEITRKKGYTEENQMRTVDCLLRESYKTIKENKRAKSEHSYYCALRDALLSLIMMYGGLRASEVTQLKFSDIRLVGDNYEIEVRNGKGGKSRFTNIYYKLIEEELTQLQGISKYVYIGSTRGSKPINYTALYKSIKKILWGTGVKYNGLHSFRHTFATEIAKSGDISVVASLLGHSNLKTTQIYIDISSNQRSKVVENIQKTYGI